MHGRKKARYFSVRFSAELLRRIDAIRLQRFGERCTLAEAIRRLLEDRVVQLSSRQPLIQRAESAPIGHATPRGEMTGEASTVVESAETAEALRRLADALHAQAVEISRTVLDLEWVVQQEVVSGAVGTPEVPPIGLDPQRSIDGTLKDSMR